MMTLTAPVALMSVSDAMPESGRKVLAFYRNRLGMARMVCAEWVAACTREVTEADDLDGDYDDTADTVYWTEGWYERIDNWDDFSSVAITEGEVTHWADLQAVLDLYRGQTGGAP